MVVTQVVLPSTSTDQPQLEQLSATLVPPPNNSFIKVTMVVRLAYGQPIESVLVVVQEEGLEWLVLLVRKADWANMRVVKVAFHKELAS